MKNVKNAKNIHEECKLTQNALSNQLSNANRMVQSQTDSYNKAYEALSIELEEAKHVIFVKQGLLEGMEMALFLAQDVIKQLTKKNREMARFNKGNGTL